MARMSSSWPIGVTTQEDMPRYAKTLFGECEIENLLTGTKFDGHPGSFLIRVKGACNQGNWKTWLALANVILQSHGGQPFEVMQMRPLTEHELMHEKLHKFQALQYPKFATESVQIDVTTTPSKDVQALLSTPRAQTRLKIQHTADIAEPK